jgi:hypothetical protein
VKIQKKFTLEKWYLTKRKLFSIKSSKMMFILYEPFIGGFDEAFGRPNKFLSILKEKNWLKYICQAP